MKDNICNSISIIIPVYNDYDRLNQCLKAIGKQDYKSDLIEVILIDNGSENYIEQMETVKLQFGELNIIIEQELTIGSYAARNTGINLSKGEILVFTDSDCIPDPLWLSSGVKALNNTKNCGFVAGNVNIIVSNPDKPSLIELYEKVDAFPQKKYVEKYNFGVTANIFTYRVVMEKVGYFNSRLKSGGDFEWGQRVYNRGYSILYENDAIVYHPARDSFKKVVQKSKRVVGGIYDKRISDGKKYLIIIDIIKSLIPPVFKIKNLFYSKKEINLSNKIRVSFLMLWLKNIQTMEYIRLIFGFSSHRL